MSPPVSDGNSSTPSRLAREGVEGSSEEIAKLGLVVLGLFAVIVAYVAHAAIPESPFTLPFEGRAISQVLPEGWAFFTRDPREPDIHVYLKTGGDWREVDQSYHGTSLGFDRSSRHRSRELGYILTELPAYHEWGRCRAFAKCVSNLEPEPVANSFPGLRKLCGLVAIVAAEPVPWAWVGLGGAQEANVHLVDASC